MILHLANAIELILKDIILDKGISIYKNPKETITISRSLEILADQKIKLPLLNKVEFKQDRRAFGPFNYTHRLLTNILGMEIPEELEKNLIDLRRLRSAVTHGKSEVSKEDVVRTVDIINDFEDHLKNINKDDINKFLEEKTRSQDNEAVLRSV